MAYCTIEELKQYAVRDEQELLRLTDSQDELDVDLVNSILEAASNLVEAFVHVDKIEDPFVKLATAKIAIYYLFQRSNNECPQSVREGWNETIILLEKMRDKKIDNSAGNQSSFTTNTRVYSKQTSNNSQVLTYLQNRGI